MDSRAPKRLSPASAIEILPLDDISPELIERMVLRLGASVAHPVSVLPRESLSEAAWHAGRGQCSASMILNAVRPSSWKKGVKCLAVTDVDLFVEGLNFIYGQADLAGPAAVISLKRLRNEFYGLGPDEDLFIERAMKEAAHEIGHTTGLVHCKLPCVMYFSNSLSDTDRKSAAFCAACRARIAGKEGG
jgi:archaemetzincin